jgi:hypothetical protein
MTRDQDDDLTASSEVHAALGTLLNEFDLGMRLKQFREIGEYKQATRLERAYRRLQTWFEKNAATTQGP